MNTYQVKITHAQIGWTTVITAETAKAAAKLVGSLAVGVACYMTHAAVVNNIETFTFESLIGSTAVVEVVVA